MKPKTYSRGLAVLVTRNWRRAAEPAGFLVPGLQRGLLLTAPQNGRRRRYDSGEPNSEVIGFCHKTPEDVNLQVSRAEVRLIPIVSPNTLVTYTTIAASLPGCENEKVQEY